MALTKVTGSVIKDSVSLSGNVSVGGTLTYQDVTNVDALGIGTFRTGINVSGGQLDVGSNIKIGNAGIITATELDISGDIDVDGHTNLDNVSITGVTTFSVGPIVPNGQSYRGIINSGSQTKIIGGYISGSDTLRLGESMYLTSTGLGINESSPGQRLTIGGDIQIGFNTPNDAGRQLNFNVNRGSAGQTLANINWQWNSKFVAQIRGIAGSDTTNKDDAHLAFFTSSANNLVERLRIDSSGRLIKGHTATYPIAGHYAALQLSGTDYNGATLSVINNANDATGSYLLFSKQRSGSPNGATIVQNGDLVGQIMFTAADGTDLTSRTAEIKGHVDGAPGSNDTPGRLSFWTTPDGAQSSLERVRITSLGRVSIGDRTTNPDELVHVHTASGDARVHIEGASDAELKLTSHSGDSSIFMGDSASGSIGKINYDHAGDDFIFTAGGNARGRIYNDAGVTGIEHHQFHPFLIGYDAQTSSDITMVKRFGGMSCIPINADGDKAFMSYTTHWRHREYAMVRFWYGASGNTSGATFDWDFTVWSATNNEGYSVGSNHTFTVQSGTMSNGKMYGYNIVSSWPSHHTSELVQFQIEYDELQGGTSLQLVGLELVEYTTT